MENITTQYITNNQSDNTTIGHGDREAEILIMFKYQVYIHFVIIPIGFVLNCLCFYIFLKSGVYKSATGIHLTYLAICDNVVIISELFTDSSNTNRVFAPYLYDNDLVSCKITFFTMLSGFLWSGVLLTSATFERFLSVAYPLKIKMWNLYGKSKILMVIYLVLSFGLNIFTLLCVESVPSDKGNYQCAATANYIDFCLYSDIVISTILCNFLTCFLIFVFTILTSIQLFKMAKERSQLSQDADSGKEFQVSLMLVTVATLFLVLRLPEIISFQMVSFFAGKTFVNSKSLALVYPVLFIHVTVNHSINFFIYIIFLQRFRETFIQLLPSCFRKCKSGTGIKTGSQTGSISTSFQTEVTDDRESGNISYISKN